MIFQENPNAKLSHAQLEELSTRLLTKRGELELALSDLNRQILQKEDCSISDPAEAAGLREEAERAYGIASQHRQTLVEINRALLRLAKGAYGVSETSGKTIAYERLLLIPWATTEAED